MQRPSDEGLKPRGKEDSNLYDIIEALIERTNWRSEEEKADYVSKLNNARVFAVLGTRGMDKL